MPAEASTASGPGRPRLAARRSASSSCRWRRAARRGRRDARSMCSSARCASGSVEPLAAHPGEVPTWSRTSCPRRKMRPWREQLLGDTVARRGAARSAGRRGSARDRGAPPARGVGGRDEATARRRDRERTSFLASRRSVLTRVARRGQAPATARSTSHATPIGAQEPVEVIAARARLVGDRQPVRAAEPVDQARAPRARCSRGGQPPARRPPPAARRPRASACARRSTTRMRTTAGAIELTSGMGWSSFVCGSGRSGHRQPRR